MSQQNRECLRSTIYNMEAGNSDLFEALAAMSDEELEATLNDIITKL